MSGVPLTILEKSVINSRVKLEELNAVKDLLRISGYFIR